MLGVAIVIACSGSQKKPSYVTGLRSKQGCLCDELSWRPEDVGNGARPCWVTGCVGPWPVPASVDNKNFSCPCWKSNPIPRLSNSWRSRYAV